VVGGVRAWELPSEVDERLREWAHFFRDRRRLDHCRSIEHRFRARSEDFAEEGWGDYEAVLRQRSTYRLDRALETHEAVQRLERGPKWAITLWFCYASLEKWRTLSTLRKYTGRRLNWRAYEDLVDAGRMRVWAMLNGYTRTGDMGYLTLPERSAKTPV